MACSMSLWRHSLVSKYMTGDNKHIPNVGNVFDRGASFSETAQASIIVNECSSTRWRRRSIFESTFDSHRGQVSDVSITSLTSLKNQCTGWIENIKTYSLLLFCDERDRETGFLLCISRTCRRQLFFVANCFEQTGQVGPTTITDPLELISDWSIEGSKIGSVFTSGITSIGRSTSTNGELSLVNVSDWTAEELFCH